MSDRNKDKRNARLQRHRRVRKKITGTADRPRLCVYRSLNHIYAQIIDDTAGRTIASASSLRMSLPVEEAPAADDEKGKKKKKQQKPQSVKVRRSRSVGKAIAEAALEKGIKQVTFDRGGYLFHGRVAALADEARKTGLKL